MGKNSSKIDKSKKQLCKSFDMKDMGHAKQILGIMITRLKDERNLYLSHEKCIKHVLEHFNVKISKVVNRSLAGHEVEKEICLTIRKEREHC